LILGATIAGAIGLIPLLGPALAIGVCQVVAPVAIAVCERILPFRSEWNRSHGDLLTDALHAAFSALITIPVVRIVVSMIAIAVAPALSAMVGHVFWPVAWPLVLQLALALVVAELPQYWLHRWQHEREWLWRFHAVHHSAPRLYWLNAARFLVDAVLGMLQHSNLDVRLGPLNYVFSMAEPHRWHHSRVLGEASTNYGSNLILWDLLFGTFFLPGERAAPRDIGIAALPYFPGGYLAQLAAPFRWRSLLREAVRNGDRSDPFSA
jgi:sterol desaturase/sphingolipid hydroxylase (fatty acid hydroxylase superfamily)